MDATIDCLGCHPDFATHSRWCRKQGFEWGSKSFEKLELAIKGEKVTLNQFFNNLHPDVFCIPRAKHLCISDEFNEELHYRQIISLPFSSTDFFINEDSDLFSRLLTFEPFVNLGNRNQLQDLVPSFINPNPNVYLPWFSHTRWWHSIVMAAMADVLLARMGMSKKERAKYVIAIATHDIAIPAGGDSTIRIDRNRFSEEVHYARIMKKFLAEKVFAEFGFTIEQAHEWVNGKQIWGLLLDVLDKISYTAIDAMYVSKAMPGRIRQFAMRYPLFADVWEDIRIADEKVYFTNPQRLYTFLYMRLLMHQEFYLNPWCRTFDFQLGKDVSELLASGEVTEDELFGMSDHHLYAILTNKNGHKGACCPKNFLFAKFRTQIEADKFAKKSKEKFSHQEFINEVKTGLGFLVQKSGKIKPLREVLPHHSVRLLEHLAKMRSGWYVYCSHES